MQYDPEAPIDLALSNGSFFEIYDADAPVSGSSFRTSHVLRLGRWIEEEEVDSADIPYPRHGFNGGQLFASPSERFVLFTMWSGQCEEAFHLFDAATLETVAAVPYQKAENATFGQELGLAAKLGSFAFPLPPPAVLSLALR